MEELRLCHDHPKADEIYERVRQRLPQISMGTVYRNLDILASSGLIQKIGPEFSQMRFDANTLEHYHITCMECGRIDDMVLEPDDDPKPQLESSFVKLAKYGVLGHKLEFLGLCRECRNGGGFINHERGAEKSLREEKSYEHEGE